MSVDRLFEIRYPEDFRMNLTTPIILNALRDAHADLSHYELSQALDVFIQEEVPKPMSKDLAIKVQDELAIEAHEMMHLLHQFNLRITAMAKLVAPKPFTKEELTGNMPKPYSEQYANRQKEAPHLRGFPEVSEEALTDEDVATIFEEIATPIDYKKLYEQSQEVNSTLRQVMITNSDALLNMRKILNKSAGEGNE